MAFLVFLFISSITLLNMLIGVLCQVCDETARNEEEQQQLYDLQVCLTDAFKAIDKNGNGKISAEEWAKGIEGCQRDQVRESLGKLGVKDTHMDDRLRQMQHTLFGKTSDEADDKLASGDGALGTAELTLEQFENKLCELRWDKPTSALDLEMLRRSVTAEHKKIKSRLERVEEKLRTVLQHRKVGACLCCGEVGGDGSCIPVQLQLQAQGTDITQVPIGDYSVTSGQGGVCSAPVPGAIPQANEASVRDHAWPSSSTPTPPPCARATGGALQLREVPTELLFHILKTRASQADVAMIAPPSVSAA